MSYILEALKKAEAERQRGAVPTLQSLGAAPPAEVAAAKPGLRYALYALGLLALLLVGLAISRWLTPAAAPQGVAVVPAPAPAPASVRVEPSVLPPPPLPRVEAPKPVPAPVVAAPAVAPVAPASAPVPTLAELPESLRRSLPPLKLGGSMYSDQPAARMLIINSVVYHEGDALAPGLTLESIGTRRAQLSFNGQRFTLDY